MNVHAICVGVRRQQPLFLPCLRWGGLFLFKALYVRLLVEFWRFFFPCLPSCHGSSGITWAHCRLHLPSCHRSTGVTWLYVGSGSGIWKSEFTSSCFCIASTSLTEPSLWLFLIWNSDVIMFELMLKHTYVIAVLIEYGPEATLCLGEFNEAVCWDEWDYRWPRKIRGFLLY